MHYPARQHIFVTEHSIGSLNVTGSKQITYLGGRRSQLTLAVRQGTYDSYTYLLRHGGVLFVSHLSVRTEMMVVAHQQMFDLPAVGQIVEELQGCERLYLGKVEEMHIAELP